MSKNKLASSTQNKKTKNDSALENILGGKQKVDLSKIDKKEPIGLPENSARKQKQQDPFISQLLNKGNPTNPSSIGKSPNTQTKGVVNKTKPKGKNLLDEVNYNLQRLKQGQSIMPLKSEPKTKRSSREKDSSRIKIETTTVGGSVPLLKTSKVVNQGKSTSSQKATIHITSNNNSSVPSISDNEPKINNINLQKTNQTGNSSSISKYSKPQTQTKSKSPLPFKVIPQAVNNTSSHTNNKSNSNTNNLNDKSKGTLNKIASSGVMTNKDTKTKQGQMVAELTLIKNENKEKERKTTGTHTKSKDIASLLKVGNYNHLLDKSKIPNTSSSTKPSSKKNVLDFGADKITTTAKSPYATTVKSTNKKKNSITEIRNFIESKEKDKQSAQAKSEAMKLLKNMNIDNNTAFDALFQKNNRAIERLTNLSDDVEEEEIVYPSIDKGSIDPYYMKEYSELINYITKSYADKKLYPDTNIKFYKYGKQLGQGAFGKVNLGIHIGTGRPVAIKSFKLNDTEINSIRRRLHLETQLMKTLNHPNVLQMYETFETEKYLMIATEYISGGDLLSLLKKRSRLSEPTVKTLFKQLLEGLKYMHSQGIIHRDVKLDNILLDADSTIKLCDLGVSKLIRPGEIMTEQCGTPAYIAPEIISGEPYSGFGADMWSAGVVLYALLSGTMPFKANNMNDLQTLIISANYPELKDISKDANNLLYELLELDTKKRLTAEQALEHPFLKDARKTVK